jgi:RNA polymerase sigma-70 factor (ECF subfamily)
MDEPEPYPTKSLYTLWGFRQFYLVRGMRSLALLAVASAVEDPEGRSGVLAAARSGDLAAFERLMRQYERLVLVTALRLAGNLPDAQDVSQDVFLKLYRNLGKLTSEDAVASWLYRVTVNACHDLRRRRRPEGPMEHGRQVATSAAGPHEALAESERSRVLELSLRMLPEKERAALVLRDLEGLSTEQVARVLGSSEATVRSQVCKARVKIKGFVARYFGRRL